MNTQAKKAPSESQASQIEPEWDRELRLHQQGHARCKIECATQKIDERAGVANSTRFGEGAGKRFTFEATAWMRNAVAQKGACKKVGKLMLFIFL